MARILVFVMVGGWLMACSEEAVVDLQVSSIVGTWRPTEQKVGIGSPGEWEAVENGPIIQFFADGSFQYAHFDCTPQTYRVEKDRIIFNYQCSEESEYAEWPSYVEEIAYQVTKLTEEYMTLSPATFICTEGCAYTYRRVEEVPVRRN